MAIYREIGELGVEWCRFLTPEGRLQMKDVLREIVSELERLSTAIIELQARADGKDSRLAMETRASKVKGQHDALRRMIDALP